MSKRELIDDILKKNKQVRKLPLAQKNNFNTIDRR